MYILYLYLIFVCHISFYCIYRHYMSQCQTTFQFIMLNMTIKLYYYSVCRECACLSPGHPHFVPASRGVAVHKQVGRVWGDGRLLSGATVPGEFISHVLVTVALTFFQSLKTFRLMFLHMHNKCKIISIQRNNKAFSV